LKYKVIKKAANPNASYDHQLAKAALQYLKNHVKGVDVIGKCYKPAVVKVTPGGK
jgi:DNA-binding transcriptional regulator LsrR (DeoR family)